MLYGLKSLLNPWISISRVLPWSYFVLNSTSKEFCFPKVTVQSVLTGFSALLAGTMTLLMQHVTMMLAVDTLNHSRLLVPGTCLLTFVNVSPVIWARWFYFYSHCSQLCCICQPESFSSTTSQLVLSTPLIILRTSTRSPLNLWHCRENNSSLTFHSQWKSIKTDQFSCDVKNWKWRNDSFSRSGSTLGKENSECECVSVWDETLTISLSTDAPRSA